VGSQKALDRNNKAQAIDLDKLLAENPNLQAIEDESGHVTITTRDWDSLIDWSSRRGDPTVENPLAQSIQDSIAGVV
jgi:hypothetical protein